MRAPHYGCQEGNGIQVRNPPFDCSHPNTHHVTIQHNTVLRYQKTGILANGDVRVVVNNNDISSAATAAGENLDDYIAANSIQVGFGAAHATIFPYGPFATGDGRTVMLGLQNEREWVQFCDQVLRQPALARDERFAGKSRKFSRWIHRVGAAQAFYEGWMEALG